MNRPLILLTHLFLLCVSSLTAQLEDRQLIVRWTSAAIGQKKTLDRAVHRSWLAYPLGIELITYPSPEDRLTDQQRLSTNPAVTALEPNRVVLPRISPNDTDFSRQADNFERTGYTTAWELTPGGRTIDNQEIVIAILDAGFDISHEDLVDNIWINSGEIPADGIDNDGNGYVDDLNGWDMVGDDAVLPNDSHGTQVAGLIGARGNNGQGISGTNWETRMMLFSINTSADVVRAYEYARDQRKRYNETNGAEGAFVVVTNASFGSEGERCQVFPVWGGMYDELGEQGILTAASTANRNWDVEINGDMPTDCTSDYLIGVTNVGVDNLLFSSSAYGRRSVDLGAPGEGSYTTRPGDRYSPFGSTSAAAPYVTGAIALLYATPCESLTDRARANPAGAALLVREAILGSTNANASLLNRTVTGGMLDVAAAQVRLADFCEGGLSEDFTIRAVTPNPATGTFTLETNALVFSANGRVRLFDFTGRLVYDRLAVRTESNPVRLRVDIDGLPAGAYLVRITERDRVAEKVVILR